MSDYHYLDKIIKDTIAVVEKSREEIYDVAESARTEYERVYRELTEVRNEISLAIAQVDGLEKEWKKARVRLMEVSRDFRLYQEDEIKKAYETAHNKQIELLTCREKEKILRMRRDHLELHLQGLKRTIQKAENLVSHVGMILKLLLGELNDISIKIGEAQQIQQLGLRIIKAQEEERKRVAREIHDGPAQSMANIVMRAEFCLKLLELNPGKVKEELISLQQLVRLSLQDVRKIIFNLRPMVLDDLGLIPAIKRYLTDFKEQWGLEVEFLFFGQETRLDSSIEITLFRIMQESLNNIRKHAEATQVILKFEILPNKVNVMIKDNGKGFDVKATMARMVDSGYGLIGMRERIQLLKGTLNISSAYGAGTEIFASIPLDDQDIRGGI